jgi:PAS domain S-box-containing protein
MQKDGRTPQELEAEILGLQQRAAGLEDALNRERRQAAEVQSNRWEAMLKASCEQSPHLAGILDLDGTLRYANRRALEVIDREPAEVIGRPIWEAPWWSHSEAEQSRVRDGVRRAAQATIQFETTRRAADGRLRYVDFALWPVREDTGGASFLMAEGRDITGRRQAEAALRESQMFLEAIFQQSPYSMWVSDSQGTLLRMNQACRELLHVTDEDLVGRYNLFEDNIVERQGVMPLVRRVFEQGEKAQFLLRYDSSQLPNKGGKMRNGKNCRPSCTRPRRWNRWDGWPGVWPTISTTC